MEAWQVTWGKGSVGRGEHKHESVSGRSTEV